LELEDTHINAFSDASLIDQRNVIMLNKMKSIDPSILRKDHRPCSSGS